MLSLVSYFDNEVDEEVLWDFFGRVTYTAGVFTCEVYRYNRLVNSISANSVEELIEKVTNEYD